MKLFKNTNLLNFYPTFSVLKIRVLKFVLTFYIIILLAHMYMYVYIYIYVSQTAGPNRLKLNWGPIDTLRVTWEIFKYNVLNRFFFFQRSIFSSQNSNYFHKNFLSHRIKRCVIRTRTGPSSVHRMWFTDRVLDNRIRRAELYWHTSYKYKKPLTPHNSILISLKLD